jgi:hypothetical protein
LSYFVSITRLRIRAIRFLPQFVLYAFRAREQARAAEGYAVGALLADRRRTFWTMTVWESADAMRAFMLTGAHKAAMPRLLDWCDEAGVVHWEQPDPALPSWREADDRLRRDGRPSKVRFPSPDHGAMTFAPPRAAAPAPVGPRKGATSA